MDLSDLRNRRGKSSVKDIQGSIEKQNNPHGKKEKDDRFWQLEWDEAGNGSATIRFLPTQEKDKLPWVRLFKHSFKGPSGKWYIENSLTTIDEKDPVGDKNYALWGTGIEANKQIVRNQKRKVKYLCNVLIIKDPKNPENEGKVKIYSFGKKIFDMISDKINPTFEDETPIDVFDFWEGANFKLRVREVEKYPNYDKSEFAQPSELCDGDEEKILEIANQQYWLGEFIAPNQFKSYGDLKKRFEQVMGVSETSTSAEEDALDETPKESPKVKSEPKSAPAKEEKKIVEKTNKVISDDDDEMSYFKGIVDDDVPF